MLSVILLVVDEDPKVLLEDLVHPFRLPVSFRMVCRGEIGLDAKQSTQGLPEMGDEMFPMVGDDVRRGSMFGEDMYQKEHSKILGINIPMDCDE